MLTGISLITNASGTHYRPRSEGDNVIGSVRPSVRPFVCVSGAKGGHYRFVCFVCFVCLSVISRACADNRADAVDRLYYLIYFVLPW